MSLKVENRLLYILILVVVFAGVFIYTFDSKVAMLGDNANYYTLGKALTEGEGYVNVSRSNKSPNNHYPPGYPAIISIALLFGGGIFTVKLLNGLFLLSSIVLLFEIAVKLTGNKQLSFVIALLTVINSHILLYSSIMMSEIPFMFFSLLAIYLFMEATKESIKLLDWRLLGAFLSMVVAYYLRSLGIALLAGFCLHLLLQKQWKIMGAYIIGLVAAALPWFLRGQKLGGSSYINQLTMINPYQPDLGRANFGDFIDRFFENFGRYITTEIPSAIFPIKSPDYNATASAGEWFVGIIILFFFFFGLYQLKQHRWTLIGYALGTFGVLMLWPSVWIGVRFIVPLIPILFIGFFHGLYFIIGKIGELTSSRKLSPLLLLVFVFFFFTPINELNASAKAPYSPAWENYFNVARWAKRNVDKDAVISCGKPALFYLYSETYTMRYKFAQNPLELIKDLEEKEVDYVVVDQVYGNTFRYLVPAIRQYPNRFEQVLHLKNPDTYLLKFRRNP